MSVQSQMDHLHQPPPTQGSRTMVKGETERMQNPNDNDESYEILASGHDEAATHMNL